MDQPQRSDSINTVAGSIMAFAPVCNGDWVLVDRSSRDPHPEGVFLLLVHGQRRIKRVQRVAGGAWLLISDNPRYEEGLIKPQDMKDFEILGWCEIRIGRVS